MTHGGWLVTTLNELLAITVIGGLMAMGAMAILVVGFLGYLLFGGHRHDASTSTYWRGQ